MELLIYKSRISMKTIVDLVKSHSFRWSPRNPERFLPGPFSQVCHPIPPLFVGLVVPLCLGKPFWYTQTSYTKIPACEDCGTGENSSRFSKFEGVLSELLHSPKTRRRLITIDTSQPKKRTKNTLEVQRPWNKRYFRKATRPLF